MTSFLQGLDDPQTTPGEKLALAVSGWLLGSDAATAKLGVAISAYHVRQTVHEYLNEPLKINRAKLFDHADLVGAGRHAAAGRRAAGPDEAAARPARRQSRQAGLLRAGGARGLHRAAGPLLRPTAAGVRSPSPLSGHRHPPRGRHHGGESDRLVGRRPEQGGGPHGPGDPPRLHRDRPGLDLGPSERLSLQRPRARRGAGFAPRRLPAVLHRHRSRVPLRPFHRRRRGLGHRPGPSRSLGRRDPHRRHGRPLLRCTGRTPSRFPSTSSAASSTPTR